MDSKTVYIVGGSNGSGKTTFAKEFVKISNIDFLNADEIEKEFNPADKNGGKIRAGRVFYYKLYELMNLDKDFVIESTLSGRSLASIIKRIKSKGFKIVLLYIFLGDEEVAIDRVRIRVAEGGHNIPHDDIIRRYYRSISNFWKIYKEISNEWQLFFNGEDNIIQTAMGVKSEFKVIDEEKYKLFQRGLDV